MANIKECFFDTKEQMTAALSSQLKASILSGIESKGKASLLVSGGSSPAPTYQFLSQQDLAWEQVQIAMVDERWVDADHEKSNEAFIHSTLLQGFAKAAHFTAMKNSADTAELGVKTCSEEYNKLSAPFDATILGMGPDGHTASLFPNANGLEHALTTDSLVCAINANRSEVTGDITERITLSLAGIAAAKEVILLISGEEKKKVYEMAKKEGSVSDIPLRAVLNHPSISLTVYWCP